MIAFVENLSTVSMPNTKVNTLFIIEKIFFAIKHGRLHSNKNNQFF